MKKIFKFYVRFKDITLEELSDLKDCEIDGDNQMVQVGVKYVD